MGSGSWFTKKLSSTDINHLVADLLFGMVMIDAEAGDKEIDRLIDILSRRKGLDQVQLRQRALTLKRISKKEHELIAQSLRDNLTVDERVQVLKDLWLIAMADGSVKRFEEAIIKRTAAMLAISKYFYKAKEMIKSDRVKVEMKAPPSSSKTLSETEKNHLVADLLFGMIMVDGDAGEKEIDRLIYVLSGRSGLDEAQLRHKATNLEQFSEETHAGIAQKLRDHLSSHERQRVLDDLQLIAMADAGIGADEKAIYHRTASMLGIS